MRASSIIALLLALLTLSACQPTVDASSEESLKASVQEVRDSLPEDKQTEFSKATMTIMMSDVDIRSMMAGTQDEDTLFKSAQKKLDGKTGEEILLMAAELKAKRDKERAAEEAEEQAEQLEQARQEIEQLRDAQARSEAALAQIAGFEVTKSTFAKKAQRFGGAQPVIELEVVNNTDQAVSRAYFKGTYSTPGRSVPWLEDEFNYQIAGGLESGESASWRLSPNMFGSWGRLDERADAVLTVEVVGLDDAAGEPIVDVEFGEREAERLKALQKKVETLTQQ